MTHESLQVSLDLDVLLRHDELCLEFEYQWQAGKRPRLEEYLAREPEGKVTLLRELLWVELDYRSQLGETPVLTDYSSRLPGREDLLVRILGKEEREEIGGGRFRVVDQYASGGLGQILVAYDRELRREVAIKEILDQYADQTELRHRFVRECRVTGRLEHPGVVPIYDLGNRPDGRPFYAMRLIRGQTLQEAIDEVYGGAAPAPQVLRELLRRLIDVARTMEYAHKKGVIHRDLKPANIVLGPYGETIVLDWGLAKILGEPSDAASDWPLDDSVVSQPGSAVGTPAYMSPEQAAGATGQVGTHSDVYGLGAMLYAVVTGKRPFQGPPEDVLPRVEVGDFRKPSQLTPTVPPALEAICLKAMAREPANRYSSASAMAADLQSWLDDEPITAFRDPPAVRAVRWVRQHRSTATGTVAFLVASTVALTIGTIVLGKTNRELETSRQLAQKNFVQARQVVDDLLTRVSEESLSETPGMQPLRQELLERALSYYREFLKQDEDNPEIRSELAASFYRASKITSMLGDREEAVVLVRRGIELQRELVDAEPDGKGYRAALAQSLDDLAILQLQIGQLEAAGETLEELRILRRALLDESPGDAELEDGLAKTLSQTAYLEWYSDRRRALETYQQARALRERAVLARPDRAEFRQGLASIYNNIALLHRELGQLDAAIEMHQRARDLQQELLAASPDSIDLKTFLAKTMANLGSSLVDAGRPDEASRTYREASQLFAELARTNPSVPEFQLDRARMMMNEAEQARRLGRPKEAVSLLLEALEAHNEMAEIGEVSLEERVAIGKAYHALAEAYEDQGQLEQALLATGRGQAIYEEQAAADASNLHVKADLAWILQFRADLLWRVGRFFEAVETYGLAIGHQQVLASGEPPESAARQFLAELLTELRDCLWQVPKNRRQRLLETLGPLADHPALAEAPNH